MLFNSIEFLFFLPIVFLLYWFVFRSCKLQNLFLVIASYIFYGWWDWRFLILIVFTSGVSFVTGLMLAGGGKKYRKNVCSSNIIINLIILGVFKYYNFFVENLDALFGTLGYHLDWVTMNLVLPVGISFYTFQALSYTIDVYRKDIRPTRDVIEFFAYISFFPQLVAGPIERATNLLPQFQRGRQFDYGKAVDGMRQMFWGFFKKLVVADNCAYAVNSYWDSYPFLPSCSILFIGILFTFQIYADFSGYSDIAIGCSRLFGFNLMRNFKYPYFSKSIPEFWRRWHISLMTWFRDYIYFPLGGSRCEKWKVVRNTLLVFFVSGLWHGANWTFICWGLYHALLIAIFIILGINTKADDIVGKPRVMPLLKDVTQMSLTFILVVLGWMIFRSENMNQFAKITYAIATNPFFDSNLLLGKKFALNALLMLLIEWLQRDKQHALQLPSNKLFKKPYARIGLYIALFFYIVTSIGKSQTFLYFQF